MSRNSLADCNTPELELPALGLQHELEARKVSFSFT